jgi:hypothetical protein
MFMLQVYCLLHEHGIHLQPEVEATTVLGTNYNSYLVSWGWRLINQNIMLQYFKRLSHKSCM